MKFGKLSVTFLAAAAIGLFAFNHFSTSEPGEPLKGAEELAALPDEQLEGAVLTELGRDAYREGAAPDAWRKMNATARHLWSVSAIKDIDPVAGLADWLAAIAQGGTTAPGPEDMAAGLEAMRLTEAHQAMMEIIAKRDSGDKALMKNLHGRLLKALGEPAARSTRRAWVRENLAALLER
jgi:hypothetical protein